MSPTTKSDLISEMEKGKLKLGGGKEIHAERERTKTIIKKTVRLSEHYTKPCY